MEAIWQYAINNWQLIIIVLALIFIAWCQGNITATKKHTADLERHLDWLREFNDRQEESNARLKKLLAQIRERDFQ